MSINKILNRPLFRNQALKKGHLKVFKAQTGAFTGGYSFTPTGGEKPRNLPIQYGTNVAPQPSWWQKFKADLPAFGRNLKDPRFLLSAPFGMGGGTTRGVSYFGLDPLVGEVTRKIGIQEGVGKDVADLGIAGVLSKNPYAVGAGLAYLGYRGAREPVGRLVDLVKERPLGTTAANEKFMPSIEGALGKPIDQVPFEEILKNYKLQYEKAKSEMKPAELAVASGRGAGSGSTAVGYEPFRTAIAGKKEEPEVTDELTADINKADINDSLIDIDKVAQNVEQLQARDVEKTKPYNQPPKAPSNAVAQVVEEPKTKKKEEAQLVNNTVATNVGNKPGRIKAGDGTPVTSDVITLARQYRNELMKGQKSQAKLVFLANLASGLMSGTTLKGGIGGALEILGRALGPAVNNYATIKLKENEMEQGLMSDALTLAADELKAKNEMVESPEGTPGIIQYLDEGGRTKNASAKRLKDGTIMMAVPGQTDQYGRQSFVTAPVGSYTRFVESSVATKEQLETLKNLSGKYKAYGLGRRTIDILQQAQSEGKKFAGPVGRFEIFTSRLGSAFEDLNLSLVNSKDEGMAKIKQMKDDFIRDLEADGMSRKEAEKFIENNFGGTDNLFASKLKQMGLFTDQTDRANLERLAINETILTYALANTLKDKDRLTEKDIKMAKDLVNIFPLLRGQASVIDSLEAVNETILGDIERLEDDYQTSFLGDSNTIDQYRKRYGLFTGMEQYQKQQNPFKQQSTTDLLKEFGG